MRQPLKQQESRTRIAGSNFTVIAPAMLRHDRGDYKYSRIVSLWVTLRDLLATSLVGMSAGLAGTREPDTPPNPNEPRVRSKMLMISERGSRSRFEQALLKCSEPLYVFHD